MRRQDTVERKGSVTVKKDGRRICGSQVGEVRRKRGRRGLRRVGEGTGYVARIGAEIKNGREMTLYVLSM